MKPHLRILIIVVVSITYVLNLSAQNEFEPASINYTVEDGLPSNETYCVHQDKKGYIWIGTDRGLVRYNGYEFEVFTMEDGLTDNVIFGIFEDKSGKLWFNTLNNTLCFYQDDKFHKTKANSIWKNFQKSRNMNFFFICSMYVDSNNITLYTDYFGKIIIENYNNKNAKINYVGGSSVNNIHLEVNNKKLHLITNSISKNINEIGKTKGEKKLLFDNNIFHEFDYKLGFRATDIITKINKDTLITVCEKDIILFDTVSKIKTIKSYSENINSYYFDNQVKCISTFSHTWFNKSKISTLDQKTITSIIKDKSNGYWFSTLENGIYYIPEYYIEKLDIFNSHLSNNNDWIIDIESNKNQNLFGISRFGKFIRINKKNAKIIGSNNKSTSIKYFPTINSFISDGGDVISNEGKLITNLASNKTFYQFNDSTFSFGNNFMFCYDNSNYNLELRPITNLRSNKVITSYNDSSDIWIGTLNGLYKYEHFDKLIPYKNPVDNSRINDISKINDKLWLSTLGNGIIIYNLSNYNKTKITTKNGLLSNNINKVIEEKRNIWVATNKGINIISLDYNFIRKITTTNGLPSNEVFDIIKQSGFIYLATRKGLVKIDPKEYFGQNDEKHNVIINGVRENDSIITNELMNKIPFNKNDIEINYISLQFSNKNNINYKYRLANQDTNWYITQSRTARFPNLQHGTYNFEVSAQNKSGQWSQPATVSFTILPAFWQTNWFLILCTLTGILIIATFFYVRYKNLSLKKELQSDVERFRYQALTSQMNPHFVFNALNSIQYYILDQNRRAASKYLSTFAKLIRQSFENSKQELIPLEDELNSLKLYVELENLRLNNVVEVEFYVDQNVDQILTFIPPLLIQPFVENAFLHGLSPKKEGKLSLKIEVKNENQFIVCQIEDNGIGRKAAKELKKQKDLRRKKSSGINITESRLQAITSLKNQSIHGYEVKITDLNDEKGNSLGTCVEIHIPKLEHYSNSI